MTEIANGRAATVHVLTLLKWTPPSINQFVSKHWSALYRAKNRAAKYLWIEALAQGVPRAKGRRRLAIEVHGAATGRPPDADNLLKVLLDSCVKAGLLTDDGPSGLEGVPEVTWSHSKSKRTTLTFEEV